MGMGRKVGFDGVVFSRRIGEDRKALAMGAIDECAPFGTVELAPESWTGLILGG